MIFGFLGCLGGLQQVQAGEIDALHLINLLKQKGILTQEEADGLIQEARKQAKAEKEELKDEIKKDGEKGAYLTKALKDFGFGTTVFAEFNVKDTEGGKTTNEFLLNRVYLTFKKKVTPWLGVNLTTDIFTSKDEDDNGNGLEVRMKYAMAELYLGNHTGELGLIPYPVGPVRFRYLALPGPGQALPGPSRPPGLGGLRHQLPGTLRTGGG